MNLHKIDKNKSYSFTAMENRENQLWWLAVLIIVLLSAALYTIDATSMTDRWWSAENLRIVWDAKVIRTALILATLLICAYFRESARKFRVNNRDLIGKLSENGKKLEKKNNEISRLKFVSDQLINITALPDALDLVLNTAVDLVNADAASVMLREKDSDILKIYASKGLPSYIAKSTSIKVGDAIAGLVAQTGKPIIINSKNLPEDLADRVINPDLYGSAAVIPIQISDDIRGVMSIAKNKERNPLREEDLGVLMALANQVSLAIQKAELLSDLMNKVDMLAATIGELRQAQTELMHAEKLASIGRLAGGVAHEINNPLQTILGRTELLEVIETDEIKKKDIHTIIEHTVRIADIVSNLLSFSRQSSNTRFRSIDINATINKTLNLLEPQMLIDNVEIIKDLSDDLPNIFGSSGQLQQIFTNIILNAHQAMSAVDNRVLTVKTTLESNTINVEFLDTGPGIPDDHLDRIFEPFYTTKPEGFGTGLGLSIAYGIAQAHGGTIQVSSKKDTGACFIVSLPTQQKIEATSRQTRTLEIERDYGTSIQRS